MQKILVILGVDMMVPDEEEKKKNDDKHHREKPSVENTTDINIHNFGSVSQEIDNILGDFSKPHDDQKDTGQQTDPKELMEQKQWDKKEEPKDFKEQKSYQDVHFEAQTEEKNQDSIDAVTINRKQDLTVKEEKQTESITQNNTLMQTIEKQQETNTDLDKKFDQEQKGQKKSLFGKTKTHPEINKEKKKTGLFRKKPTKNTEKTTDLPKTTSNVNQTVTTNGNIKSDKKKIKLFSKKEKQKQTTQELQTPLKDQSTDLDMNTKESEQNPLEQKIHYQDGIVDQDVLKLLAITDDLLGKLPEDVISDFASSEDFKLYKKVMDKYNIGK